ncbi:MAG: hypothetical protein U5J64_06215 [Halobacteriales archaeon]|nr:hypothetical protein [Halobacteriales archaeon]
MESTTVKPDELDPSEHGLSDALREAVKKEMEFLEKRGVKLVRMRSKDDGEVFQVTIHAGDEMYRMSEVAPGHVSRTVFRNPEKDDAMPYQDEGEEEAEDEGNGEEDVDSEETDEEADEDGNGDEEDEETSGETESDGETKD